MKIEDGTGNGVFARVDNRKRLETTAVTEPEDKFLNKLGYAWTMISSTTAVGTNDIIFYLKNTGENALILTNVRAFASAATTLSFKKVTGTPSYTSGTELTAVNRNLGSSRTLQATAYQDTNTTGLTEQTDMYFLRLNTANQQGDIAITSGIIIPQGTAIAMDTSAATLVTAEYSVAELIP